MEESHCHDLPPKCARIVPRLHVPLLLVALWLAAAAPARALDHVTLARDGRQIEVEGRVVVTAQDGGILLAARDGTLWAVQPEELVEHRTDDAPFAPFTPEEMAAALVAELPPGFAVHQTAHYVICYDTSRSYASWCGWLFERLYMAFTNHWSRKGLKLSEPEFPLTAIVFADRRAYARYSAPVLGEAAESIIGYFDERHSNRMVMYDLTGMEAAGRPGPSSGTLQQINRILAQPGATRTVATIVHEATHQIAFNCGLHNRYSDCPRWFSEGVAVYFETPDLGSRSGWSNVGEVNRPRLAQFRGYLPRRPADSLLTLIADDARFHDTAKNLDAYAEAWALTYFLLRQHPDEYVAYLKLLSAKRPLMWDTPEERLADFKQAFGDDLEKLDREFLRSMAGVR